MPNNNIPVDIPPNDYPETLRFWQSKISNQSKDLDEDENEFLLLDNTLPQYAPLIEQGEKIIKSLYGNDNLSNESTTELFNGLYNDHNIGDLHQTTNNQSYMGRARDAVYYATSATGSIINPIGWVKSINRQIYGENENAATRRDYLMGIVAIMWFIFNQAKQEQDKTVERGSFKIIDPDLKLYNLLLNYVTLANHGVESGATDKSIFYYNDFAYTRSPELLQAPIIGGGLSSHYRTDSEQYGIDIRFHGGEELSSILPPGDHRHLLFGLITIDDTQYTFLKCEEFGLGSALESFLHGTDYVRKMGQSHPEGCFREKDIDKELITIYQEFCKATGKEVSETKLPLYEIAKTVLHTNIQDNQVAQNCKNDFIEQLKILKLDKNPNIRHGNEVIIDFRKYNLTNCNHNQSSSSSSTQASSSSSSKKFTL